MEQAFEESVQNIIKVQADTAQNMRILQAENDRLRKRIAELEQQRVVKRELNTTVTVAVASVAGGMGPERPHKFTKMLSKSLHPGSAIQRLVQTASPRPPNADDDDEDDEGIDDGEDIGEDGDDSEGPPSNNNPSLRDGKARFKLIAHSGDEREKICPRSREITIPVLVKSYVEFEWKERPRRVLVMMRPGDDFSTRAFVDIIQFLWERGLTVLVETGSEQYLQEGAHELTHAKHEELHKFPIDFVVTLGGDGTFIRAAYAFPNACPPILAFAFGSLGFLTPFPASALSDSLTYVLDGGYGLRLRARLEVEVRRENQPTETFQVLNECVVDRGSTSSLVRLMLFSSQNGQIPVTTVQGDGLIIATPTGSTAYSLSAGGSMVHPSVPAILVTPICPHSLSFRPILVPDSATLRVQVAAEARNSAWLSIDGRKSIELQRLDELVVRFSSYPVPAVMPRRNDNGDSDGWLSSLRTALNWNVIQAQKPLNLSTVKTPLVETNNTA